jgi:toxin ParE1/3/4
VILSWLPIAINERYDQLEYIALDDPLAAISQDEEIEQQTNLLATQPNPDKQDKCVNEVFSARKTQKIISNLLKMGRIGRVKGTRELVISRTPFIAVYRIAGQRIEILRFLHGAQKWPVS